MAVLNIDDAAVAAKARKLAELTGKSIAEAVSDALDKSLGMAEQHTGTDREAGRHGTDEIAGRSQASVPTDAAYLEEITDDMYDQTSLPK